MSRLNRTVFIYRVLRKLDGQVCTHPFMHMYTRTCPECGEGSEELTEQQLFAQDLLDVFLAFHRETLSETVIEKLKSQFNPLRAEICGLIFCLICKF